VAAELAAVAAGGVAAGVVGLGGGSLAKASDPAPMHKTIDNTFVRLIL
jgi:hypothetical protein